MKKLALFLFSLFFVFIPASYADNLIKDKDYYELPHPQSETKQVIEFFSFYCGACFNYEFNFDIPNQIKQAIPSDAKLIKYHVNWMGDPKIAKDLTRAWAIATVLKVEDKIMEPLFDAVQKHKKIKSMPDIRQVFIDSGVESELFDQALNSMPVNILVTTQEQATEDFKIKSIPNFVMNNKYTINRNALIHDQITNEEFIAKYIDAITILINKRI